MAHDYRTNPLTYTFEGVTVRYAGQMTITQIHAHINAITAQAKRLAPRVAEEALESCCTNTRPTGPKQARAWDLVAQGFAWNALAGLLTDEEGMTRYLARTQPQAQEAPKTYVYHHRYSPPAGDMFQVHADGSVFLQAGTDWVKLAELNAASYRKAVAEGLAELVDMTPQAASQHASTPQLLSDEVKVNTVAKLTGTPKAEVAARIARLAQQDEVMARLEGDDTSH
jgi:hypothetical protein